MIKRIKVTDDLISSVRRYLNHHNLGNRGVEDGSPRKQEVGMIGEMVTHHYLTGNYPNLTEKKVGFDGGYDLLFEGRKIDVKTIERKSYVRPYFVNNFYILQERHDAEILVFCSYHGMDQVIEICGWLLKSELPTKGIFYAAGTKRNRTDGSSFLFRQDNYEVEVKDLECIEQLKNSKSGIHPKDGHTWGRKECAILSKPFLAKCGNRSELPKSHPESGCPEHWFSETWLNEHALTGITFDFFVDWSSTPFSLSPEIWIKRIVSPAVNYEDVIENIEEILIKEFGVQQLKTLNNFGVKNNLKIQFILFKDAMDWTDNAQDILVAELVSTGDAFTFNPTIITLENLKTSIQKHSGGPVKIGSKGLFYSTSNLECHLSRTDSLYPGDVDLIILDKEGDPVCILEFKKHTLDTSISDQKLSNYYPKPDGRKYNRLAILKEYLSKKNGDIPIFIVYYPTKASFREGRLELLKGEAGNLFTRAASNFPLPGSILREEINPVIGKLLKGILYHHAQIAGGN